MDGPLTIAIRVMYHGAVLPLQRVHTVLFLCRPQRTLFLLFLFTILVVQTPFSESLAKSDAFSPRGVYAASPQRMAACQELLVNGNLEASGGWRFGATPAPGTVVDAPVHAGAFAMRLGISTGNNTVAYSTAYQTVALPATAEQIVLTYWERAGATGDSGDYREVIALRTDFTVLRSLERQPGAGNEQWTQRTFDLTDLRGQSIVLYFNVYNNGSGASLVNYLDDLSLQSCDATAPATPTLPPTPTHTSTPAVTEPAANRCGYAGAAHPNGHCHSAAQQHHRARRQCGRNRRTDHHDFAAEFARRHGRTGGGRPQCRCAVQCRPAPGDDLHGGR